MFLGTDNTKPRQEEAFQEHAEEKAPLGEAAGMLPTTTGTLVFFTFV